MRTRSGRSDSVVLAPTLLMLTGRARISPASPIFTRQPLPFSSVTTPVRRLFSPMNCATKEFCGFS